MSIPDVSSDDILSKFAEIVAESLRIDAAKVTAHAYLDDLGAESLDLLEITMEAEEAFHILIPQKNILQVAQEIFGQDVLVQDGKLTEEGRIFLRRRMPEVEALVSDDVTVADLNKAFLRVDSWVRMIGNLIDQRPKVCAQCGARLEKSVAGRLKCGECAAEHPIPSGDDLNREWVQRYYQQHAASSDSHYATSDASAAAGIDQG